MRRCARDGGADVVLRQWDAAERVRAGRGGERRRHGEREAALRQPVPDRRGPAPWRSASAWVPKVTVKEDPKSLPSGYEPLTQEANGVPYANPVRLDSAVAGAAVLFVNVPTSVAARLNQGTPAVDAGGATDLAHAVARERTGCDPAYPDERTCIAPGRPLAEPCSITDQRNFTVLAPDPRGLDADRDGIGCEPISPSGGTIAPRRRLQSLHQRRHLRRAAPARTGDVAVAASPVRSR